MRLSTNINETMLSSTCGPNNQFEDPSPWPQCVSPFPCSTPPPDPPISPQVGEARLIDPGLEFGPCLGRNTTDYQPIPSCPHVELLVLDREFTYYDMMITEFRFKIPRRPGVERIHLDMVLSHDVDPHILLLTVRKKEESGTRCET